MAGPPSGAAPRLGPGPPGSSALLPLLLQLLLLLCSGPQGVEAEVAAFNRRSFAEGPALEVVRLLYGFAAEDAPAGGRRSQLPTVTFTGFEVEAEGDGRGGSGGGNAVALEGVQVGVIPWLHLFDLVDLQSLCHYVAGKPTMELSLRDHPAKASSFFHTPRPAASAAGVAGAGASSPSAPFASLSAASAAAAASSSSSSFDLDYTGPLALVVASCPGAPRVRLSGEVSLRNPFGYLAGNEFHRPWIYHSALVAYALALVLWVVLMCLNVNEIATVHLLIVFVLFCGLAEASIASVSLAQSNSFAGASLATGGGLRAGGAGAGAGASPAASAASGSELSELLGEAAGVAKQAYLIVLALVAARALANDDEDEDDDVHSSSADKASGSRQGCLRPWSRDLNIAALYAVTAMFRTGVVSARPRLGLSLGSAALSFLPSAAVAFGAAAAALRRLARALAARGGGAKEARRLASRLALLVGFSLLGALAAVVAQLSDEPGASWEWWAYHAFVHDGLPQVLFASTLAAVMLLLLPGASWAPDLRGQRLLSALAEAEDEAAELEGLKDAEDPTDGDSTGPVRRDGDEGGGHAERDGNVLGAAVPARIGRPLDVSD